MRNNKRRVIIHKKSTIGNPVLRNSVAGRVVFLHDNTVIKVIDLSEKDFNESNKIKIVNNGIDELVKQRKIGKDDVNDVMIETEHFPSSTFLSSASNKHPR